MLERATLENLNWHDERFTLEELKNRREFTRYFDSWPGERDFGFASVDRARSVHGVVWLTFFSEQNPGYGFVRDDMPELSVWVAEDHRGAGIGRALISTAVEVARSQGIPGVSLSVEAGNPARRLYERLGFRKAGHAFDEGTLLLQL